MKNLRYISPALFFTVLICFMLPFISVSCGGNKVASFSGCSLTTGTNVDSGYGNKQDIKPDLNLALLWLSALTGIVLGFFDDKKIKLIKLIVNGGGLLLTFIFMARTVFSEQKQNMGVTIELEGGIFAVLFFLGLAMAWHVYEITQKTENIIPEQPPPQLTNQFSQPQDFIFCPNCKAKQKSYANFCTECGQKIIR